MAGARRGRSRERSAKEPPPQEPVRLQKLLAGAGLGSRREIEGWIEAGRLRVDGAIAVLGTRATPDAKIELDGKPVRLGPSVHPRALVMNKPEGMICTRRDPEGRRTVFSDLPRLRTGRWIGVGRLDAATTGLLLFTNDGELAHRLMHPSTGLDREYAVRVDGELSDEQLAALKAGIDSEGERLRFSDIRYFNGSGRNHWYHVTLLEGRNHEVRRLFASQDVAVGRLKRVRFGPVVLPSWLRRGSRFELNGDDLRALYRTVGLAAPVVSNKARGRSERAERSVLIPYPELPGPGT